MNGRLWIAVIAVAAVLVAILTFSYVRSIPTEPDGQSGPSDPDTGGAPLVEPAPQAPAASL